MSSRSFEIDIGAIFESIKANYQEADEEPSIERKRHIYNKVFIKIQQNVQKAPSELKKELYKLFEIYVTKTWYGKTAPKVEVDASFGFYKTLMLMEYSFLLQLEDFGLSDDLAGIDELDWKKALDLEQLLTAIALNGVSMLFNQVTIDKTVLVNHAQDTGTREILANTLIWLTYAQQNIPILRLDDQSNQKWEDITKTVIGNETGEQRKILLEYEYNRLALLFERIINEREFSEDQVKEFCIEKYEILMVDFEKHYDADDPVLLRKISEINYHQGSIFSDGLRYINDDSDNKAKVCKAIRYFHKAFTARAVLMNIFNDEYKLTGCMSEEHKAHEYSLSNIRIGIINCLLCMRPFDRLLLKIHRDALAEFDSYLQKIGENSPYRHEYRTKIQEADMILKFDPIS